VGIGLRQGYVLSPLFFTVYIGGSQLGVTLPPAGGDIIPEGTRCAHLNDKRMIYLLLSCVFCVFFAMDYTQKREVR